MADDMIDIEEHDVMENPIIKQIFPDLSILKKEIIDYDDEIQELSNLETRRIDGTENLLQISSNRSNSDKLLNTKNFYNNKIILDSKNNKNIISERGINYILISDVKVYLQNIRPELIRSRKFCQTCLILFSKEEALYNHRLLCHSDIDHEKTCLRQICNINSSSKKQKKSEVFTNDDNNFHFMNTTDEAECTSQNKKIRQNNVMVKIVDPNFKSVDKNLIKPCFHCNVVFPSRQSLIDHLYEILNNKNANFQYIENIINKDAVTCKNDKILQNVSTDSQRMNIDRGKDGDDRDTNKLYSCPICSYYFDVKKSYKWHLLSKHKLSKKINIKCAKFYSKCKFCHLNCNDILSYNVHLRKRHSNEIVKKPNEFYSHIKNKNLQDLKKTTLTCKKGNKLQNNALERHTKLIAENLKSHEDKVFKKKINEVRVMALKAILFKCIKCNVHFLTSEAAINHFEHSEYLQHWKCSNCQKVFKQEQRNLHEKQHKYSNYFTVVEVNNDARELNKCRKCGVHFRKEIFLDHQSNCESDQLESDSRVCDILIEYDQAVSHKEISNQKEHYTIVDTENYDTIKKIKDMKQNSKTLLKKYKHFYFCDLCKCNIPRAYNVEDHLQSSCIRFIKYVCDYCGLVLSNRTIRSHKRLHQKYNNLRLQDFIFFDLKTKTKIKPISDLPKCGACEKHFIYKYEIVYHRCEEDYVTCPVCKIKLTDSALKLHEPFHSYNLNIQSKSKTQLSNDLMSCNIGSSVEEVKKDDQNLLFSFSSKTRCVDEFLYLYTCKNCDMSMNIYDDVIEHCHSHTHLNEIEIEAIKCTKCNINFIRSAYNEHEQLHLIYSREKFKYFNFDVLYFNAHNDEWLDHVFGTLPRDMINKIIEKSIYRFENKVRMEIIQHGPYELTIYKCDKCQSFIDSKFINKHIVNCSTNSVKFYCKMCNIPFISNISRSEHENIHLNRKTTLKSYRIVIFNREQDNVINQNLSKTKYYVLFECRYCHVIVDKNFYNHECNSFNCKSCNVCGLLVQEIHYDNHVLKHKVIDSFNKYVMKIVLIANKAPYKSEIQANNLISTFSGMVCDYTFYKCAKCDVCVRDQRNTIQHYCLINAAKSKCPQCDLIFDEGKIKGHLKLHDTDPDITKDTIIVKTFGCNNINKEENSEIININIESNKNDDHEIMVSDASVGDRINEISDSICTLEATAKIYKCYCGLHFINETQIKEHLNKCSGVVRVNQSRQDCFKCGLTFTSNVLFQHLLNHHGGKNIIFEYEIIEHFNNSVNFSS